MMQEEEGQRPTSEEDGAAGAPAPNPEPQRDGEQVQPEAEQAGDEARQQTGADVCDAAFAKAADLQAGRENQE